MSPDQKFAGSIKSSIESPGNIKLKSIDSSIPDMEVPLSNGYRVVPTMAEIAEKAKKPPGTAGGIFNKRKEVLGYSHIQFQDQRSSTRTGNRIKKGSRLQVYRAFPQDNKPIQNVIDSTRIYASTNENT